MIVILKVIQHFNFHIFKTFLDKILESNIKYKPRCWKHLINKSLTDLRSLLNKI